MGIDSVEDTVDSVLYEDSLGWPATDEGRGNWFGDWL